MQYTVHRVETLPPLDADWDSLAWSSAATATIECFIAPGHDHKPKTQARLLHDGDSIAVMFRVEDRYVIAKWTQYQDRTHKDSCVEFFLEPVAGKGYFNFEFNCIGALLLTYIEDARRKGDGFEKYTPVAPELAERIGVHASMSGPILEEIAERVFWTVSYRVPKSVLEAYVGPISTLAGMSMRGNLYKCADECSRPHWGYWADIGEELDFHQPKRFVPFVFEG